MTSISDRTRQELESDQAQADHEARKESEVVDRMQILRKEKATIKEPKDK